jgi:competence ComEA-like helix-hairpin-helix protein
MPLPKNQTDNQHRQNPPFTLHPSPFTLQINELIRTLVTMNLSPTFYSVLLSLGLVACQQAQPQTLRPSPLPQDEAVQVYMNQQTAAQYTEPYRQQSRSGDDLEQVIVDAIASATTTIDVAVQELRLPKIAQALRNRHAAGVKVRIILENLYARPYSSFKPAEIDALPKREQDRYQEAVRLIDRNQDQQLSAEEINQGDALVILDRAKIPRLDDTADGSRGSNLMHHKFLVIDGQTVIVTSANLTTSDIHGDFASVNSRGNANNLLKIQSSDLATRFTEEFNVMWGDGPGGKPDSRFGTQKPVRAVQQLSVGQGTIAVHFSPTAPSIPWAQSSNGVIADTLNTAKHAIDLALFVFSDQHLANQLEPNHLQGKEIRALIDPGFMYRSYSEGLDLLGVELREDCQAEAHNRPWAQPITTVGVPRLPPGDLLHHKFGIVDSQTVITGSHNWTHAANHGNDETLLVVQNPIVAAHYQREFERLYADAILGVPPAIEKKAAAAQQCPPSTVPQTEIGDPELMTEPRSTPSSRRPNRTVSPKPAPDLSGSIPPQAEPAPRRKQQTQPSQALPPTIASPVNLNTATAAEIEALPGIGPGLARRIVAARNKHPFASLADLDRVPGIGPKLLKKLQGQVTW